MSGGYRGRGFSRPSKRWDDSLSRMDPLKFEALVADYYRGQGYRVVECGTGGTKSRFDGGIDLKLYRDDEYIVVQCKRYTNSVVKHNDVHQLLGIMHTEGATRAIFINSGEYSRHALQKLQGIPNFQMIDGVQLREMMGPQLGDIEEPAPMDDPYREIIHGSRVEKQRRLAAHAADRLTDRSITYTGAKASRRDSLDLDLLLKVVAAVIVLWMLHHWNKSPEPQSRSRASLQQDSTKLPVSTNEVVPAVQTHAPPVDQRAPIHQDEGRLPQVLPRQPTTKAELREWQRKADESMEILKETTPEM
jgi:restriction system protein